MEQQEKLEINIMKPQEADYTEIMELFYVTWLDTYINEEFGITREDIEVYFKDRYDEQRYKSFKQNIDNGNFGDLYWVAKNRDKVVGVCRLTQRETCNQLQAIYVLPEFQGKGIGKTLWKKSLEVFGTEKKIIVQLATYNDKARKFYESLGFVDNGKRFSEERHTMPVSKNIIPEMEMELNFTD